MTESKTILFAADDPGGANYLAPVVSELATMGVSVHVLAGEAAKNSFARAGVVAEPAPNDVMGFISELEPDCVVCGTAEHQESLDKILIRHAKDSGVPTIGVIDYWTDYAGRYRTKDGRTFGSAPDYLLVVDNMMKNGVCALGFPSEKVMICGHPHFDLVLARKSQLDEKGKEHVRKELFPELPQETPLIVFMGEPLWHGEQLCRDEDYLLTGYSGTIERPLVVLEEVLKYLQSSAGRYALVIRKHPKNKDADYEHYLGDVYEVTNAGSSLEMCYAADLVMGLSSMALFEAVLLGIPVMSVVPKEEELSWLITNECDASFGVCCREEFSVLDRILIRDRAKIVKELGLKPYWVQEGAVAKVVERINEVVSKRCVA